MFDILQIDSSSVLTDEQMGTKEKFWCINPEDNTRWLFKFARINNTIPTGEDWAEKPAHEIGELLAIPTARVSLARFDGKYGSISRDFTRHLNIRDLDEQQQSELIHGNELLHHLCESVYPKEQRFRVSEHTVSRVHDVLKRDGFVAPIDSEMPVSLRGAQHVFCGYLMLDSIIGNTDRHHENWAVQYIPSISSKVAYLSPSFDHASSLGRELLPKSVSRLVKGGEFKKRVEMYSDRARSALYLSPRDQVPLSPLEALHEYGKLEPEALDYWKGRLMDTSDLDLARLVGKVPPERMSQEVADHTVSLLVRNKAKTLGGVQ